jgi:hypothetical protein
MRWKDALFPPVIPLRVQPTRAQRASGS